MSPRGIRHEYLRAFHKLLRDPSSAIGMAILTRHFNWSGFVEISITMLGVAAVSKGFVLIVFPAMTLGSSRSAGSGLNLSAFGFLLAGAWYSLLGYGGVFA